MKIAKNILELIEKYSSEIGRQAKDDFEVNMHNECPDMEISSPIEQIFYITFSYIQALNSNCFPNQEPSEVMLNDGAPWCPGLGIYPQRKIGKYRVDFLISYQNPFKVSQESNQVIVECDSQQFHDRTEKERRYEKTRDRFLQSKGYQVFRFTGKEIIDDPIKIVLEIICHLTEYEAEEILEDSNIEPK